MPEISIRKFNSHYFMSPADRADQQRLDRLRVKVLEDAFGSAIDRAGLPRDGELCIRDISAPVRFRLNPSEQSIVAHWSSALAENLTEIFHDGPNAGLVFYYSRRQAIFDLVFSVSRSDYRRAWAWQLLGLWKAERTPDRDAVIQLVRVLCREANLIVPALRLVATAGYLPALARRLSVEQWAALADAASSSAGVNVAPDVTGDLPSSRTYNHVLRVLRRSSILAAVVSSGTLANEGETIGEAIATLACLDVEPALLHTKLGPGLLALVAASFNEGRTKSFARFNKTSLAGKGGQSINADERAIAESRNASSGTGRTGKKRRHAARNPADSVTSRSPGTSTELTDESAQATINAPGQADRDSAPAGEVLDPRRKAFTEFGGLMFLLAVIETLKLPEEMLADAALGSRLLTWTFHQLALALVPAEPNDAAVLAFAGLPPDATPPSKQEPPVTANEKDALQSFVGRIVDFLSALLHGEYKSVGELIKFVCCRRAQVVADPAWIEIRFSLDQVATEIRRAGLDLDPGYLSWLGVVVKFVYE